MDLLVGSVNGLGEIHITGSQYYIPALHLNQFSCGLKVIREEEYRSIEKKKRRKGNGKDKSFRL